MSREVMSEKSPALVVHNIGQLLTMADSSVGLVEGDGLTVTCDEAGRILSLGAEEDAGLAPGAPEPERLDAGGGVVTPGLVDPHTHPVFAGQRSVEFGLKARGATYMEIHRAAGCCPPCERCERPASSS